MVIRPTALPEENLQIYQMLYMIEVGLREFIFDTLSEQYGVKWWKQRLPPDVRSASKERLDSERGVKWWQIVPLHPMYYTDFPDLKKVILQNNNWDEVFKEHFGTNKDLITGTLVIMEPIRNKVAHNRKATTTDREIIEGVYEQIASIIGSDHFHELTQRCTMAPDINSIITELQAEAYSAFTLCQSTAAIDALPIWQSVRTSWWFDADYLGDEVSGIAEYFKAISEYAKMPRYRGMGYQIEAWVRDYGLAEKYEIAHTELSSILGGGR